jgi:hypothetical protein
VLCRCTLKEAAGLQAPKPSWNLNKKKRIFVDMMISIDLRNLPISQTQLLKSAIGYN